MRYVSYLHDNEPGWGLLDGESVIDLTHYEPSLKTAAGKDRLADAAGAAENGQTLSPAAVSFLPPVPDPARILCIGQNYAAHRDEMGADRSAHPAVFTRYPSSVSGHNQTLLKPAESDHYDYEGELAVIIGKPGRRIRAEQALDHIAGYSCFMDGSIRDFQGHTTQYTPGKNFDATGSCGPWMIPAEEMPDPNAGHRLETRLNGATVQSTTTDLMLFPAPALIAYISTFTTLEPGDVIATGTPGGVGYRRKPRLYMSPGDQIEVELEGIGTLVNTIGAG